MLLRPREGISYCHVPGSAVFVLFSRWELDDCPRRHYLRTSKVVVHLADNSSAGGFDALPHVTVQRLRSVVCKYMHRASVRKTPVGALYKLVDLFGLCFFFLLHLRRGEGVLCKSC